MMKTSEYYNFMTLNLLCYRILSVSKELILGVDQYVGV